MHAPVVDRTIDPEAVGLLIGQAEAAIVRLRAAVKPIASNHVVLQFASLDRDFSVARGFAAEVASDPAPFFAPPPSASPIVVPAKPAEFRRLLGIEFAAASKQLALIGSAFARRPAVRDRWDGIALGLDAVWAGLAAERPRPLTPVTDWILSPDPVPTF